MEKEENNNVYHLEVQAYNNCYGNLIDRDSFYSGVYSTLEKALEEGKWFINKRFKDIYEQSDYCTNEEDTLTLEDMLKDDMITYHFKVTELDPVYADNFNPPKMEYMCRDLKPTHTVYYYDYKGKLKFYELNYLDKDGGWGYTTLRYEDDDESKPNKFKVGDFVTVIDEEIPSDQVFIVYGVPIRNNPKRFFDNTYYLSTINDGCKFNYYYEFNESKIKKYEGIIEDSSPLMLLKKIYTEEIEISQDVWDKIQENKILLNTYPSFRDIEELN